MDDASQVLASASDTIAALASVRGPAALSVIRISGREAFAVLDALCLGLPGGPPRWGARRARLRLGRSTLSLPVRVFTMPGPRSFTGEDQVELHLPGGEGLARMTMELLLRAGARQARPGEFTRRAYRNGKLDLAQAEAVAALVHAESEAERRGALALLREGLGADARGLAEGIVEMLVPLELDLDFSDQDIDIVVPETLGESLRQLEARARALAEEPPALTRTRQRPRVVLAGPPNAGKSSLFNRLTRRELALVSNREGTTRDYLEAEMDCEGVAILLVDTAGRGFEGSAPDEVAHRLREREIVRADLVLEVGDVRHARAPSLANSAEIPRLQVLTHGDLCPESPSATAGAILIAGDSDRGLDALRRKIAETLMAARGSASASLADHARRRAETFVEVREALTRAREALADELGHELVAEDLQEARRALRRLTGEDYDEAVLDRIMARFCIGK
jgi:tRNA modification GTPase